jgi:hypothetical protein
MSNGRRHDRHWRDDASGSHVEARRGEEEEEAEAAG